MSFEYQKIYNEDEYVKAIETEKLDIWICSYGGCGSNFLHDHINKYRLCGTECWYQKMCHYTRPLSNNSVKFGIYIYRHPIMAYISQYHRNLININFCKLREKETKFDNKKLFELMKQQVNNWSHPQVDFPVILVRYEKLHEHANKIMKLLGIDYDLAEKVHRVNWFDVDKYKDLCKFNDCMDEIHDLVKEYEKLPDFEIIWPDKS